MAADDVRMRGFRERTEVTAVERMIDERVRHLQHEPVEILEAGGRVLALDAVSPVNVPGFDRSAMDGYAVTAEATFGATPTDPSVLRIVGESLDGERSRRRLARWPRC